MTVHDLTRPQLSELKQAYLCELFQNPSWGDLAQCTKSRRMYLTQFRPSMRLPQ